MSTVTLIRYAAGGFFSRPRAGRWHIKRRGRGDRPHEAECGAGLWDAWHDPLDRVLVKPSVVAAEPGLCKRCLRAAKGKAK